MFVWQAVHQTGLAEFLPSEKFNFKAHYNQRDALEKCGYRDSLISHQTVWIRMAHRLQLRRAAGYDLDIINELKTTWKSLLPFAVLTILLSSVKAAKKHKQARQQTDIDTILRRNDHEHM